MRLKDLTEEQFISIFKRISIVCLAGCFNRCRPAVDRIIGQMAPMDIARMTKKKRERFVRKMKNNPSEMKAWINKIVAQDKGLTPPKKKTPAPETTVANAVKVDDSLDGAFEVDVDPHMDSELAKLVPSVEYLNKYVGRKVNGFDDFEFYDKCRENGDSVLVSGPTGSGKTMSFWAYAHKMKLPVLSVNCHGMTTAEAIVGTWQPSADGFVWRDGTATKGVQQPSIIIIEEINMSDETLSSIWYSLLDGRKNIVLDTKDGTVLDIHPGTLIVATMNPNYAGTHPLNQALNNRFNHKLVYGYDTKIEKKIIRHYENQDLIQAFYDVVTDIRDARAHEKMDTDISTRDIVNFMKVVDNYNVETAYNNFINSFPAEEQDVVDNVCDAKGLKGHL